MKCQWQKISLTIPSGKRETGTGLLPNTRGGHSGKFSLHWFLHISFPLISCGAQFDGAPLLHSLLVRKRQALGKLCLKINAYAHFNNPGLLVLPNFSHLLFAKHFYTIC